MEWQPIETAPKAEFVDVWVESDFGGKRFNNLYQNSVGWWINECQQVMDIKPTHWMPLPKPPTK